MKLETRYGKFGGLFVPETLIKPLTEVETAFIAIQQDRKFQDELQDLLRNYAGRPTPITHVKNLSALAGRPLYLKREDLVHGGAHKTNNTIGQGLLARYMGKKRIIAETGAGQHGVATAMIGALLGIPVEVYMGKTDVERQAPNVKRMQLFGAKVHSVESGSATLKDAINEAMRDWISNVDSTYYCFGTAAGPHPFPALVRYFQQIIGLEARAQFLDKVGSLPEAIVACVGGGSNAIGLFSAFLKDTEVAIYGAEAAGKGLDTPLHAATLGKGSTGAFHGMYSYFLQNQDGQITETHSVSAGLDYPGVGPEHAYLHETGRVKYLGVTDIEALDTFGLLARSEGILGALESCHALALAMRLPGKGPVLVNLSGRGDKDLDNYFALRGNV
ncbi:MAG: tryptophan synthase subunit beta [Gammaproteobacteria bacterium]|nr:tryptophan synthase subunit beta [Gammaproteobacteria bacterium]